MTKKITTKGVAEKEIRTTSIRHEDMETWDESDEGFTFLPPSKFYIKTAMHYVYFHTQSRKLAQEQADKDYPPAGKYKIAKVVEAAIR